MSNFRRILILAQVPPPTHGQSVMVGHFVKAAEANHRDRIIHVNLRLSKDAQDVGTLRPAKLLALAWCGVRALHACIFRNARDIYYVPAPGKRGTVIRDVLLLTLLKPFTHRLTLHWHSVGLGNYLSSRPHDPWANRLRKILTGHYLSLCLSKTAAEDIQILKPDSIAIVPNGIPDPCPHFPEILEARLARLAARLQHYQDTLAPPVRLLYLGLCTQSKGIFEVLSTAIALLRQINGGHSCRPIHLTLAGPFPDPAESKNFSAAILEAKAALSAQIAPLLTVELVGFAGPELKKELLEAADLFVFPTTYENEGLPLTLLEALAFGLPILTTRWRSIPEALPPHYPWLVSPQEWDALPALAENALHSAVFQDLRDWYLAGFTLEAHLNTLFAQLFSENSQR